MYCLECKQLIKSKIDYKNIFKKPIDSICNSCFVKYLFISKFEAIPIESGVIYLNILFDNIKNPLSLMNTVRPYYLYYLKSISNNIIVFFDSFDEKVYNSFQNICFGDIYMIVFQDEKQKEIDYEDEN